MDQPLLLSVARRLELTVVPPAGPDGRPWRVDTIEIPAEGRSEIRSAPPLVGGFLSWNGLGKGRRYRIRLLTDAGVPWYVDEQPFVADQAVIQRSIEPGSERTRGVVLQGKSPLKNAVLTFGGKHEEVQVRLLADRDGRFEGLLPRIGEWKVHVSATDPFVGREVKANVVRAADGYGDVEVRLDDVAIRGEIVDEDGTLYERQVIFRIQETSAIGRPYYSDHVVQGGRFVVAGLPNGSFSANADLPDLVSDDVKFEVGADEETPPLRVVLRPKKGMRLRVLSPAGKGLGGLRVVVLPSHANPDSFPEGTLTDLDGRAYKAVSPSDSTRCVLLVGSDFGLPAAFGTVSVDGKETTHTLPASGGTLDLAAFEQATAAWVGSGSCWMNVVHLRRTVNARSPGSKTVYLSPGEYRLWPSRPASWQSSSQWSGYLKPGETLSPAAN